MVTTKEPTFERIYTTVLVSGINFNKKAGMLLNCVSGSESGPRKKSRPFHYQSQRPGFLTIVVRFSHPRYSSTFQVPIRTQRSRVSYKLYAHTSSVTFSVPIRTQRCMTQERSLSTHIVRAVLSPNKKPIALS
jgi:hypothetical protein